MNPNPLVVWKRVVESEFVLGFDHRFHSEVSEQDSTQTGDALPKEALDYQAVAQQVQRRQEEESSAGAPCSHGIAETHLEI